MFLRAVRMLLKLTKSTTFEVDVPPSSARDSGERTRARTETRPGPPAFRG